MKKHWLYHRSSLRKLWVAGFVLLFATLCAEWLVELHPHFTIESVFGFYAGFGFLACVVMVLFAKLLGKLISRPDDYYEQ